MRKKSLGFLMVALPLLAGCQSTQEIAAADDDRCRSYGLAFGTPEYAQCRQFQQADHTRRYEADKQAMAQQRMADAIRDSNTPKRSETLPTRSTTTFASNPSPRTCSPRTENGATYIRCDDPSSK